MSAFGMLGVAFLGLDFLSASHAIIHRIFSASIRLSCHSSFVGRELLRLNDNTIDWNDESILELDHISNMQLIDMGLLALPITDNYQLNKIKSHARSDQNTIIWP